MNAETTVSSHPSVRKPRSAPRLRYGRDLLSAARNYLGNPWALLALGSLAVIIIGLSFGGWGWLVAIGAAPIVLSLLPCVVMCGLGVCTMCRSNKSQSEASHDASAAAASSAPLTTAKIDQPSFGSSSCCQGDAVEAQAPQAKQVQSVDQQRRRSHA